MACGGFVNSFGPVLSCVKREGKEGHSLWCVSTDPWPTVGIGHELIAFALSFPESI